MVYISYMTGPDPALVELIARAIFESFQDTQDNHLRRDTWDSQIGLGWRPYHREAAKAAIAIYEKWHRKHGAGEDVSHEIRPRFPGGSNF